MLIEIHGAGFHNKGAQLMLEVVLRRVAQRFPNAEFCVEWDRSISDVELRRLGLKTFFVSAPRVRPRRYPVLGPLSSVAGRLVPGSLLRSRNMVARHWVDALIDISGYAFGDKMPLPRTQAFASRSRYYARRGKPVVMLPQMFGPFESGAIQAAMRRVCDSADLIYARDTVSYGHVEGLFATGCSKLRLAPDIAIFAEPDPGTPLPDRPYACIVPNARILDKGGLQWRGRYIGDLVHTVRLLRQQGLSVLLTMHESSGEDRELANQILAQVGPEVASMYESNCPFQLKAVFAGARLAVASRFHAVVSALSSGTPAIVLGWAHKYEMLMHDFGCSEYMHDAKEGREELEAKILALTRDETHCRVRAKLLECKNRMYAANAKMWDDVFAFLENGTTGIKADPQVALLQGE